MESWVNPGGKKSVTSMSIPQVLIPSRQEKNRIREILSEGRDSGKLSEKEMRQIRGNEIAMTSQDSMTGFKPGYDDR